LNERADRLGAFNYIAVVLEVALILSCEYNAAAHGCFVWMISAMRAE